MFGLRVPLVQSLSSADFDGVNVILNKSILKDPSKWLTKVNKNGEIFELHLENSVELFTQPLPSEKVSLCSDCGTDDTGYGTDNEAHSVLNTGDLIPPNELAEFADCFVNYTSSSHCATQQKTQLNQQAAFRQFEEDIDILFQSKRNPRDESNEFDVAHDLTDINSYFTEEDNRHLGFDSHKIQYFSQNETFQTLTLQPTDMLSLVNDNDNRSEQHRGCLPKNRLEVVVKLKPKKLQNETNSTVELCEYILGFVPGHTGTSTNVRQRKKDKMVKIRSILPNGVCARYSSIKVGDCLLSINEQRVTWDNLASLLSTLQFQRQAKLLIRPSEKTKTEKIPIVKKDSIPSSAHRLTELITGSNNHRTSHEVTAQNIVPFYGAMYLSLEGINSDNMQAKEDIVYQFPKVDNKVISSRGMFITLAGSLHDALKSTIQSTTLLVEDQPVHIVYHCEGPSLFVFSAPEHMFSLTSLTMLVKDLVRLLQVIHGSVHHAFTSLDTHYSLDCFFTLLHEKLHCRNGVLESGTHNDMLHNLSQGATVLCVPQEVKNCADRMLTEFESADFGDMSDSYYGCRRSYSVLGSCLFYKDYLISSHLAREDLVDVSTYLRYHGLLALSTDPGLGQLVAWREVYPTRNCHTIPDEQQFGYSEPLIARWFWLIVGYKNLIMCVSLETGGCTKVVAGVSPPDPFLIDQARAVLLQLYAQDMASVCQTCISSTLTSLTTSPPSVVNEDRRLQEISPRNPGMGESPAVTRSRSVDAHTSHSEVRKLSSNSLDSVVKPGRKGRLYPEVSDCLYSTLATKVDSYPLNTNRKLSVGMNNCLFHLLYIDNLEGVLISSSQQMAASPTNEQIHKCFKKAAQKIKTVFASAKQIKEQSKTERHHVCGSNDDFVHIREEGVMFTCNVTGPADKKLSQLCYWVVGRLLSRSKQREMYVCFLESTPQAVVELAFKTAFGRLPL
ncbi:protein inturned-like [Dreissena polymorpha]|nr:protein inturned-like [Dreissena polymorpha]